MTKIIKNLVKRCIDHDIGQLGAQLSYFSLLSLFPFIVYINKLITILNFSYDEITEYISLIFPANIAEFIFEYINIISETSHTGLLSLGTVMLIYSASRIVRSMEKAINLAYEITEQRGFFTSIFRAMLFVACFGVTIILIILTTVISKGFLANIFSRFGVTPDFLSSLLIVKWAVFAVAVFIAMALIYYLMPNKKIPLKTVFPGAAFCVVGFALLSLGFSIYVNVGLKYSVLYGSIGAVFLLLIWLYATGMIIVAGAELNCVIAKHRKSSISQDKLC